MEASETQFVLVEKSRHYDPERGRPNFVLGLLQSQIQHEITRVT